jgi:hypothetical protein
MQSRRRTLLGLTIAVAAVAAPAQADDGHAIAASFQWTRRPNAEACTDDKTLAAAVERQLGHAVFGAGGRVDVAIEARVEQTRKSPPAWRAVIRGTKADGSTVGPRELVSAEPECGSLDRAAVLVVALMIDPAAALRSPEPAVSRDPPEPAPPSPPPPAANRDPPEDAGAREIPRLDRTPAARWRGEVRLEGSGSIGLLPGFAPGGAVAGVVEPPRFVPIEARLGAWSAQEANVAPGGGSFALVASALSLCPTLEPSARIRVTACLGAEVGSMRAEGFGFDRTFARSQTLAGIGGGVRVATPIAGALFVTAGVRGLAPLVRPRFTYATASGATEDIYRMAAAAGAADIGAGYRF